MTREGRPIKHLITIAIATAAAIALGAAAAAGQSARSAAGSSSCPEPGLGWGYVHRVTLALRARRDVWGDRLLASRNGPTYDGARRFLAPLVLARAANGRPLTDSGVHYTPFAEPEGAWGAVSVALHVADGSQIVSQRAYGRRLTIAVGRQGEERYGSCLARLGGPALLDGYLPVLETHYVDAEGVRYEQESFAADVPQTRSLVSFVRITADATSAKAGGTRIRLTPSLAPLHRDPGRLSRKGHTYLFFSPGGSYNGASVKYSVSRGSTRTVYAAWLNEPMSSRTIPLDETSFDAVRDSVRDYWERRLLHGGTIVVPERRVDDAERTLLIQNLALTWRYSIGNPYEQFSSPEGIDVSRVMAEYGQSEVTRAILHTSLRKRPKRFRGTPVRSANWKMGARLVGTAEQARLSGDRSLVTQATPVLRGYVRAIARQISSGRSGLLDRERYSSDVSERVYGLHSQAVVWQGLRSMGAVWAEYGQRALARKCLHLAARLGNALHRTIRRSQRRLPDGSLFIPVRLLSGEKPYQSLTSSRNGSYWNLVMPYALASGIIPPGSAQARGVYAYMQRHGSRILGIPRSGAFALYGPAGITQKKTKAKRSSTRPVSGSNPVYALNASRFLADLDQPGQLVLTLYGELAAAMAPGTFVSGEGVSIAPLGDGRLRAMYLPPNGASNAAFLETLRLLLIHEREDRAGVPTGLDLAFATPRTWLLPGRSIDVRSMPTSFGKLSYSIDAGSSSASVSLTVPDRVPLRSLRLRLRLPDDRKIEGVLYDESTLRGFDPKTGTIALPTTPGDHELLVQY